MISAATRNAPWSQISEATRNARWSHGANIERYRKMLKTHLTDNERQFIEQRISEEQEALSGMLGALQQASQL